MQRVFSHNNQSVKILHSVFFIPLFKVQLCPVERPLMGSSPFMNG
nr:MAG TPA: hypothetical protein [Caudoviricetes sp.]